MMEIDHFVAGYVPADNIFPARDKQAGSGHISFPDYSERCQQFRIA